MAFTASRFGGFSARFMGKTMIRYVLFLAGLMGWSHLMAFSWADLWYTRDQQGAQALSKNQPAEAAKKFEDPAWKGAAYYREQDYAAAAEAFGAGSSAEDFYNTGNALAQAHQYEQAIQAYDEAIKREPHHTDALYNREIVKKLLQSDQQQKQSQPQNESKQPQQQPKPQQSSAQSQSKNQPKPDQSQAKPSGKQPASSQAKNQPDPKTQRWLGQIPDDPGGLLKQKFLRDHQRLSHEEG